MERWALSTPRPVRVARRDAPQLATAAALLGFVWSRTLLGAQQNDFKSHGLSIKGYKKV